MKTALGTLLLGVAVTALPSVRLAAQNVISAPLTRIVDRATLLSAPMPAAPNRQNIDRLTLLPGPTPAPSTDTGALYFGAFPTKSESMLQPTGSPTFRFVPGPPPEGMRRKAMAPENAGTLQLRPATNNGSFAPPITPSPDLLRFDRTLPAVTPSAPGRITPVRQ